MPSAKETSMLNEFDEANRLDKILIAYDILEDLDEAAKKSKDVQAELEKRADEVQRCRENYALVSAMLNDLNSEEGWKLAKQKKDTIVHYKYEDGSNLVTTKAETLFPIARRNAIPEEFVKLVSLFNESDLMPRWFPNKIMHSCQNVKQVSTFAKFLHMLFHPPAWIPVSKRDAVVLGRGYDMTENGALAISYETKDAGFSEYGYTVPESTKKYTRVETKGVYYVEIVNEGIKFKTIALLDIKLPMLPNFLLNIMSKQGPFDFISNVKKTWANYAGSEWESRIRTNPELYDDVRDRVTNFLGIDPNAPLILDLTTSVENLDDKRHKRKTLRKKLKRNLSFNKRKDVSSNEPIKPFSFDLEDGEDKIDEEESPLVQMVKIGENLKRMGEELKLAGELALKGAQNAKAQTVEEFNGTVSLIREDAKDFMKKTKGNVKDFKKNVKRNLKP